jgi:hypothetical protein
MFPIMGQVNVLFVLLALAVVMALACKFKILPFGMAALAADRDTPSRDGRTYNYPLAAAKLIYEGSLCVLDSSGNAAPGSTATGLVCIGRARGNYDNSAGSAGDISGEFEQGVFQWGNSASTDAITKAEIGDQCYIVDDQTVAKTSATSTRSVAGIVVDVDSAGVWVRTAFAGA